MAKIQPITFPILGTANELNLRVMPFRMEDTTCAFYYEILRVEEDGKQQVFTSGNLEMTEAEFAGWGSDNYYCINWAANKLGLTIINN